MCLSARLVRRETATALESTRHNPWRREHRDEALNSTPAACCFTANHGCAIALGGERRRGGAGVHNYGEQRQDLSTLGLSRKVCGSRVAQQRVPLRAKALQQRQHAAAT